MKPTYRVVAGALLGLLWATGAAAQDYPSRPIRFVIPYPPGGNTDVLGRLIGAKLTDAWGQQVVIDNRPGAAGTLGAELVARAPADGYTLIMGTFGNMIVANSLYTTLKYQPLKDFAPVVLVALPPGILVAHPAVPARDLKELVAHAGSNPGRLNYGSPGAGAWNHLFFELFKREAKIDVVHVAYKGIALALVDLVGGRIQLAISAFPPALPHVRSERLRALAVTGAGRSPVLPQVPTMSESGLPGYRAAGWFAVMAPARTPGAVVARLNSAINRILASPDVKETLARDGAEPVGGPPDAALASLKEDNEKWSRLVRDLGIRL
jgi:tripartite-type tricarboxylate transporter receptor subunit TctC